MKAILYVFYLEAAISLLSAVQAFFMPVKFLNQLSAESAPVLAVEMTRWYGVILFVLVYLLLQGLRLRGTALQLALQALLVGDILQIWATFVTAKALGGWSFTLIMSAVLSLVYLLLRAVCLLRPKETGIFG